MRNDHETNHVVERHRRARRIAGGGLRRPRRAGRRLLGQGGRDLLAEHIPRQLHRQHRQQVLPSLKPGTTFVYEAKQKEGTERNTVAVTHDTKRMMGVECVVVRDRVFLNGSLTEDTSDWYAQDNKGNVWYFGEATKELQNGKVETTQGSWEAGVDGAKPGIIMQADPKVGETYRQEYYKDKAEDMGKVLSLNESATVPDGSFDYLLMTKDWSPIDPASGIEQKYYAPGIRERPRGGCQGHPREGRAHRHQEDLSHTWKAGLPRKSGLFHARG
ncbi:MAG: hypothetical protein M3305_06270 [Actinomycetota bacterium]|nr:hypothetical protein [Actinomycetota bacterium]